jgi:hypothetical protein
MSFTFVTALYEINREVHDNRSFETYQTWFNETLKVPVPFVIFTEEKNRVLIEKARHNMPTMVIYKDLKDFPFFNTLPSVESIIRTSNQHNNSKSLEFTCYDYIPLVNSKFVWMLDAINNNWFNTDMFFWIDAGLSRFMQFDMSLKKFNIQLISKLKEENLLYIQIGKMNELQYILNNQKLVDESIGYNVNFMMAGFWGGNTAFMQDVCELGKDLYHTEYINKNRVDNEQVLFGFILQKYKNQLLMAKNIYGKDYINYDLFCDQIK